MARANTDPLITPAEAKARLLAWGAHPSPAFPAQRFGANPVNLAVVALAAGAILGALFKRRRRGGLLLATALFGRSIIRYLAPVLIGAVVKRATR